MFTCNKNSDTKNAVHWDIRPLRNNFWKKPTAHNVF